MLNFIALECIKCGGTLRVSDDRERFTCNFCGTEHLMKDGVVSLSPVMDVLKGVKGGVDKTASELAIRRVRDDISELQAQLNEAQKKEQQIQKEIDSFAGNWVRPRLIEINRWLDENKQPKLKPAESASRGARTIALLWLAGEIGILALQAFKMFDVNVTIVLSIGGIFIAAGVLSALQNNTLERREYFQIRRQKLAEKRSLENGKVVQGLDYQNKYTEKQQALNGIRDQENVIQAQIEKKRQELAKHEQIVTNS